MRIIALLNQKGGVGKTTSTISIGAGLAQMGKKILLVDCDPQSSLTCSLGYEPSELSHTWYDVITKKCTFEVALKNPLKNVWVMPTSINLAAFEKEFTDTKDSYSIFKTLLGSLTQFDYIFLDCPPTLALLTLNSLTVAHEVFIPVQTEFLALQGLSQLLETLTVLTKSLNKDLKIGGIFATRYNRRKINKSIAAYIHKAFKDKAFKTVIRESVDLIEAPSFGKDIFSYAPHSLGAQDYRSLCAEVLAQEFTQEFTMVDASMLVREAVL
jgi:chromosome partitioning protein